MQSLRSAVIPLATLEPEGSMDDLEPLAEHVGSVRVVGLGESAHYVHEFYDLRHRLTRFLIDRLGISAVAMESGLPEGFIVDRWIQGGPGDVADVQAAGITWSMGLCDEMRDQLNWLRDWNRSRTQRVHFYGVDLPGSRASMLPALDPVTPYLAKVDALFLPRFNRLCALASRYASRNLNDASAAYMEMAASERDEMTALLADTEARFDARELAYIAQANERSYSHARRHVRSAVQFDRVMRQFSAAATDDPTLASASIRDAAMAEAMELILQHERRVVLLAHNDHVRRTPISEGVSPLGHHLASRLGDGYLAIGTTFEFGTVMSSRMTEHGHMMRLSVSPEELTQGDDGLVDSLLAAERPDPYVVDLRRLDRDAAAVIDSRTHMRSSARRTEVSTRQAFDMLVAVPRVSLWHASSTPPVPHVD
jgi:erythromycin esterase